MIGRRHVDLRVCFQLARYVEMPFRRSLPLTITGYAIR